MLIGFANNIIAVLLSVAVCYGIATELDLSDRTMSWYTHKVFATFLYVIPVLFAFTFVHRFVCQTDNLPISLSLQIQSRLNGTTIMWSLLLLASTAFNLRSAYMFFVPLVITLLSNVTISFTGIQNSSELHGCDLNAKMKFFQLFQYANGCTCTCSTKWLFCFGRWTATIC